MVGFLYVEVWKLTPSKHTYTSKKVTWIGQGNSDRIVAVEEGKKVIMTIAPQKRYNLQNMSYKSKFIVSRRQGTLLPKFHPNSHGFALHLQIMMSVKGKGVMNKNEVDREHEELSRGMPVERTLG